MINKVHPEKLILVGYLTIILIGTLFLTLPISVENNNITFVDALFTSTSAVCVTGLIVKDTEYDFSLFGQIVILILVQIGGLGYMILSTALLILFNKNLSGNERFKTQNEFQKFSFNDIKSFIKKIFLFTFTVELIGALLLFPRMKLLFNSNIKALWYSIFHSISSFCNAGFSIFSNNLIVFKNDTYASIVIAFLIIIGGLGFIALGDIYGNLRNKKWRFSVHTKIVLIMTLLLIIIPLFIFIAIEKNNVLSELSIMNKITNSFFQIITPRTAGFNTLNISSLKMPTLFFFMILMFIGGSPGGTAGGIKTTTLFLIIYSIIKKLSGKKNINIFFRRIKDEIVLKSFFIFTLSIIIIFFATFILLILESEKFSDIIFEVFSAYGTVGLSTGSQQGAFSLSGDFSNLGKLLIIFIMFTGRVGIMTAANAFINKTRKESIEYPETKIMIG